METKRLLFLDLEDTVIKPVDSWMFTDIIPRNIQKVKQILNEFNPDEVHIFSFAIWNQAELLRYNMMTAPMLEKVLNVKLQPAPTVDDDMIPAACAVRRLSASTVDFQEMSSFWGKQDTFKLFIQHTFKHNEAPLHVMLVDDAVFNEEFSWPDTQITGSIVNIDRRKL